MNKVIIAVCDEFTKQIIKHCVKTVNPGLEIIDGSSDADIVYHLKSAEDDIIFFDKYFLSYELRFKMKAIRAYSKKIRIVFCEQGNCSRFFGLRVYDLKADGFVSNIQDKNAFVKKLRLLFSGQKVFPEEVLESLDSNEHLRNRKYCSEVTELELEIAMYLGEGKSIKEIHSLTQVKEGTIGIHINRLKCKLGCENMNEFFLLYQQYEKMNLRSWSC